MRRNMWNRLLVIFALAALTGCKAHKQLVVNKDPGSPKESRKEIAKLDAIRSAQLDFKTFSGRARARLQINNSSNDVTMNLRIQHGKKIWVSITAIAGIEVARAEITPDSILAINKLQGLYVRQPFSYIYKYASSQLDFNSVEALLTGNAIPQLLNDQAQMSTDSAGVALSGNLQELVYKLIVGPDLKARTTDLTSQDAGQAMQVDNRQFIPVAAGNRVMASQIDINSTAGTKKIKLSMHYIREDFDQPLEYPFSIPDSYAPAK
ncbi:MAG: DUF4292 domain-containing protein [Bacteroidetes bacterium]|nr:DUF4292 domain-containing protein [Bacteroidota bacterium]